MYHDAKRRKYSCHKQNAWEEGPSLGNYAHRMRALQTEPCLIIELPVWILAKHTTAHHGQTVLLDDLQALLQRVVDGNLSSTSHDENTTVPAVIVRFRSHLAALEKKTHDSSGRAFFSSTEMETSSPACSLYSAVACSMARWSNSVSFCLALIWMLSSPSA